MNIYDGVKSLFQSIINDRSAANTNYVSSDPIDYTTMNAMYKSGLGSKIIRLKAVSALSNTLGFESSADEKYYMSALDRKVKQAAKFMMAFGRGIVVVHNRGEDLSRPLKEFNYDRGIFRVFSGDMVTVSDIDRNLESARYQKPRIYNVWGNFIHHSRVIDFTYVQPTEYDLPQYRYGGISEFELIYEQFIADGIIQRACPSILEKSSNWIYKIQGFNAMMKSKQDTQIREVFSAIENMRSIYGATIVDANDTVESLTMAIQNLGETDQIALRRLAMVTGIPLTILVGEPAKGLNSTGENELSIYDETLKDFESEYLLDPLNELAVKIGLGRIKFNENQGQTPIDSAKYEKMVIENAVMLSSIGEDHIEYLGGHGIKVGDDYDEFFSQDINNVNVGNDTGDNTCDDQVGIGEAVNPDASLNGAQVTSMLEIIERVATGVINKNTAAKILSAAFPLSLEAAISLLSEVKEGSFNVENQEGGIGSNGNNEGSGLGKETIKGLEVDGIKPIE